MNFPFKFEAGTPDYIGTTALAKALDYVSAIGMDKIAAYENELTAYAMKRLKSIEGMRIFGEAEHKSGVISFLVGNIHHLDMGTLLDRLGIAVRTGHHCAQPLMIRLGIEGTVRASFGLYNTKEEVRSFGCLASNVVSKMFCTLPVMVPSILQARISWITRMNFFLCFLCNPCLNYVYW